MGPTHGVIHTGAQNPNAPSESNSKSKSKSESETEAESESESKSKSTRGREAEQLHVAFVHPALELLKLICLDRKLCASLCVSQDDLAFCVGRSCNLANLL